jgi:hypothetical protein
LRYSVAAFERNAQGPAIAEKLFRRVAYGLDLLLLLLLLDRALLGLLRKGKPTPGHMDQHGPAINHFVRNPQALCGQTPILTGGHCASPQREKP